MSTGKQENNRAELTAFIKALSYIRVYVDFKAIYYYGQTKPKTNKI